jgi:hypothetical protein
VPRDGGRRNCWLGNNLSELLGISVGAIRVFVISAVGIFCN